jgi:pimeloyl-ACP methyl ester carboxylesterase
MKIYRFLLMLFAVLSLQVTIAKADTMVLIHGYLGDVSSWDASGITTVLQQHGWQRAGVYVPGGVLQVNDVAEGNRYYLVDLPSEAPVAIQANHLRPMLTQIASLHPEDKIILVGHSAGGVVARLMVVEQVVPNIDTLITIASPHLGTPMAADALDYADTGFPFSMFQRFFNNDLYHLTRRGSGLFVDLLAPRPGNLLFWLNSREHPGIHYYSVVRQAGDQLVPGFSQDMNNVPVLRGQSGLLVEGLGHTLRPDDGQGILSILDQIAGKQSQVALALDH